MIGVENFYLNTPLNLYEYMRMKLGIIPDKIIK